MLSIENFLKFLRLERNYSQKTVDNYKADLEQFKLFFGKLKADLSWKDVDGDIIRDWIENMMDKGNRPFFCKSKIKRPAIILSVCIKERICRI